MSVTVEVRGVSDEALTCPLSTGLRPAKSEATRLLQPHLKRLFQFQNGFEPEGGRKPYGIRNLPGESAPQAWTRKVRFAEPKETVSPSLKTVGPVTGVPFSRVPFALPASDTNAPVASIEMLPWARETVPLAGKQTVFPTSLPTEFAPI